MSVSGSFDRFTVGARKVLTLAQEEARRFNHNYIGTEHLLLGLVRDDEEGAAAVLADLGVKIDKVRSAVEFIIGRGERQVTGEIGLTPRAKKVIQLAIDEARRLGHAYIGSEHLLLGLIREGEGIAAGILENLGVGLERLRTRTLTMLSESPSAEAPGSQGVQTPAETGWERHRSSLFRPPAVQWEYLLIQTARDEDGILHIQHVNGEEDPRLTGDVPFHAALHLLGEDGWELVSVDRSEGAGAGGLHVFKRPKRGQEGGTA